MRIVFATTQSTTGSTVAGRILPLARELSADHDVSVLILEANNGTVREPVPARVKTRTVGHEPFIRSSSGKRRAKGVRLIFNMLSTALKTAAVLFSLKPDAVVIAKPLPANTLGVLLWRLLAFWQRHYIITDTDDFELAANQLSSLKERAAVHWAERTAAALSSAITTASPFLSDHFRQLSPRKKIVMVPTGLDSLPLITEASPPYLDLPTILYAGSLSAHSGHRVDLLPEILSIVRRTFPNARLLIAGSGDDEQSLKKSFENHGLGSAVTWFGRFRPSDLAGLLAQTTLLIDPADASITQRAKSSFRVLLAAREGMPVVTSDVGIRPYLLPESVHDRFFAPPGDAADYARRCVIFMKDPLPASDRRALIDHARQFAWKSLADQFRACLPV